MARNRVRIESRLHDDGTSASLLVVAGSRHDLGALLTEIPGFVWDARRETPLDALLQSGRFAELLPALVAKARSGTPAVVASPGRPLPPVIRPGKILALGRTYREHALELGNAPVSEPLVFDKLTDSLVGDGAIVPKPDPAECRLDHEAELAIVVGTRAWRLPDGNGRKAIAGVTVANDLTRRTLQKAAQKAGHPWVQAKSFPGACALGPHLTPVEPADGLDALRITCRVNGAVRQDATTGQLVKPVGALVEWISQWMPLNPGDVLLTGTPAGTGPLVPGDVCEIDIAGDDLDLGTLVTRIG